MLALLSGTPALRMSPPVMLSGSEAVKAAAGVGRYSSFGSGAQPVGGVVPIPPKRPRPAEVQVGGVVPTNRPVPEEVPEVTMPSKRSAAPKPIGTFGAGLAERPATVDDRAVMVQGGALRTWSYASPAVERVQVILSTEGRPLEADIELYQGPPNTPLGFGLGLALTLTPALAVTVALTLALALTLAKARPTRRASCASSSRTVRCAGTLTLTPALALNLTLTSTATLTLTLTLTLSLTRTLSLSLTLTRCAPSAR